MWISISFVFDDRFFFILKRWMQKRKWRKFFLCVCRSIGYIPSNYVKEKELLGLQKYEWVLDIKFLPFYPSLLFYFQSYCCSSSWPLVNLKNFYSTWRFSISVFHFCIFSFQMVRRWYVSTKSRVVAKTGGQRGMFRCTKFIHQRTLHAFSIH